MAHAWNGPDPASDDAFPTPQELGTEYRAEVDITITGVRIYTGPTELNQANRKARIWSTGGGQLGIASLPTDMPEGWSEHLLDVPVTRLASQRFLVSWSSGGNEPFVTHALDGDVVSADGNVTALSSANATAGNSKFGNGPGAVGVFPPNASGNAAFFGSDVVYTVGIGGNTPPRITSLKAKPAGALVTATATVVDDETLVGATYRWSWGDGSADDVTTVPTAQHTYSGDGVYAVQLTVTDASAATAVKSAGVQVLVPPEGNVVEVAAAELAQAIRAKLGQVFLVTTDPGGMTNPPAVVVGPPLLTWEAFGSLRGNSPPTSATFTVFVVEQMDEYAVSNLWSHALQVTQVIEDDVLSAVVTTAAPGLFAANGQELPCYSITVEMSLS